MFRNVSPKSISLPEHVTLLKWKIIRAFDNFVSYEETSWLVFFCIETLNQIEKMFKVTTKIPDRCNLTLTFGKFELISRYLYCYLWRNFTRFFLHSTNLRIQSECGKIRTRKNSVSGHFSPNVSISETILNSCMR